MMKKKETPEMTKKTEETKAAENLSEELSDEALSAECVGAGGAFSTVPRVPVNQIDSTLRKKI